MTEDFVQNVTITAEPGMVYWQLRCTHCGLALLVVHSANYGGPRPLFCPACAQPAVYFRVGPEAESR